MFASALCASAAAGVPLKVEAKVSGIYVPDDAKLFWEAPRQIHLARAVTGESLKLVYWRNGEIDQEGYRAACYLLRDVQAEKMYGMSIRTLDLLRAIQGWLAYFGKDEPIIVLSGYRTALTNKKTEGAARMSRHLTGSAVDMRIHGIPTDYLAKLAGSFQAGGLGFYPGKRFIHADDGPRRAWTG